MTTNQLKLTFAVIPAMLVAFAYQSPAMADSGTNEEKSAVQINTGNDLVREGKFDQAIEAYRQVTPTADDHEQLNYNLAVAEYRNGNIESAEKLFTEVSSSADAAIASSSRYNLGNCLYANGIQSATKDKAAAIEQLQQAISHYRGSLRGNPDNTDARANIELAGELIRKLREEQKQEEEQKQQDQQKQDQKDQQKQDQQNDQQQDQQKQDQSGKGQDDQQKVQEKGDEQKSEQQQDSKGSDSQKNESQDKQDQQQSANSDSKDQKSGDEQSKAESKPSDSAQAQNNESKDQQKQESEPNSSEQKSDEKKSDQQNEKQSEKDAQQQSQQQSTPQGDAGDKQQNQSQSQANRQQQPKDQQSNPVAADEQAGKNDQPIPTGELTAAGEQDKNAQKNGTVAVADPNANNGVMSKEEAMKMLQAVRDRDMLRRMHQEQLERSRHIPVTKDW